MGKIIRYTSSFARPADATAYTAGDEISNHATAASVVRAFFDLEGAQQGKVLRGGMTITPASGNVVITAANLSVLLFKVADVPAAVGDNVTNPITAAVRSRAIAELLFDDGGWINPLGAFSAATSAIQEVPPTLYIPLATPLVLQHQAPFTFSGVPIVAGSRYLVAVCRALAAWDPANVVNTIGLYIDVEVE